MSKAKPKTQAQLDRATDLRLKKTYGVGLDWYNTQFENQGGGCAVCGDGPGTRRLHVDHDHTYKRVKIEYEKVDGLWVARALYRGLWLSSVMLPRKTEVSQAIKGMLRQASIRALLCHRCNRAMILFRDKPELLRAAADYLEKHQNPLNGRETT